MPSLLEKAGGGDLRIETARFFLRPLTIQDCMPVYLSWLNDDEVSRYTGRFGRRFTQQDMESYVKDSNSSENRLLFGIFTKDGGIHIGNVLLGDYDAAHGLVSIANMIGDKRYWGNGTAVEVDKHLIDFGFKNMRFRKFMIGNMAPHRASTFMSTQLGFQKEAVHKDHFIYEGKPVDVIYFGLFPEQFYQKFPEFKK